MSLQKIKHKVVLFQDKAESETLPCCQHTGWCNVSAITGVCASVPTTLLLFLTSPFFFVNNILQASQCMLGWRRAKDCVQNVNKADEKYSKQEEMFVITSKHCGKHVIKRL